MLNDSQLVKYFPVLLKALKKRIPSLPGSLPLGDAEGPLARYLGNLEVDAEEGAAFSANRQWERAFQASEEEQRKRIVGGKYGLDLVCPFLEFFSEQKGTKGTDSVGISSRPGLTSDGVVPTSQFFAPKTDKTALQDGTTSVIPAKRTQDTYSEDDVNDKSYHPPKTALFLSEEDSDVPDDPMPAKKGKEKTVVSEKSKTVSLKPAAKRPKLKSRQHNDDSDEAPEPDKGDDDAPKTKAGRDPKRSRWAISNYTSPPTIEPIEHLPVQRAAPNTRTRLLSSSSIVIFTLIYRNVLGTCAYFGCPPALRVVVVYSEVRTGSYEIDLANMRTSTIKQYPRVPNGLALKLPSSVSM
ncbi:hypothetical protein B0H10DRAFT_2202993 [Mycena sp. CBHHK59/15]|nr:hypothetical protein B0H10DRAFT_2202993 [Mycena sp. CBHHK59/15]